MNSAGIVALVFVCALGGCNRSSPTNSSEPSASTRTAAGAVRLVKLEHSAGSLDKLLAQHAAKAKTSGDKPFVYLSATWCDPCKKLHASLGDPRIIDAFRGASLIELDIDDWGVELEKAQLGAKAIPTFYELDSNGKATGRKIDGGAWGDDVPENMAPPLKKFFAGG